MRGVLLFLLLSSIATVSSFISPIRHVAFLPQQSSSLKVASADVSVPMTTTNLCSPKTTQYLQGKNVVLTGASGGLGRSFALEFVKAEVKELVLSGRNIQALEETKKLCEDLMSDSLKSSIHVISCDLADGESVEVFGSKALELCNQKVDILVNNGGISSRSSFIETSIKVDQLLMQVNFFAGAALAKKVVPSMVKNGNGGAIIWISSVQGVLGTPFRTSYAASKFAVQGYCDALRSELAPSNITVHCPSPGYIRTNLSNSAITGDGSKYGKTDATTANGADPNTVAAVILDSSFAASKSNFLVAAGLSAKIALILKFFFPSFLEKMLVKRFQKEKNKRD